MVGGHAVLLIQANQNTSCVVRFAFTDWSVLKTAAPNVQCCVSLCVMDVFLCMCCDVYMTRFCIVYTVVTTGTMQNA